MENGLLMIPVNRFTRARDKCRYIVGSAGFAMQFGDLVNPVCIEGGIARAVR